MVHPEDTELLDYAAGVLAPAAIDQIEAHLMRCILCLDLVYEYEGAPLHAAHATEQGRICLSVHEQGRMAVGRLLGSALDISVVGQTVRDANVEVRLAFARIFPRHCCGQGCTARD